MGKKTATIITRTCPACKKDYTGREKSIGKHCSRDCQREAQSVEVTSTVQICEQCTRPFRVKMGEDRRFCSTDCCGKAQRSRNERVCLQCQRPFEARLSSDQRFCRMACAYEWRSENQRGEAHPLFGRQLGRAKNLPPPTTKICPSCNKSFAVKPAQVNVRLCCSHDCYGEYQQTHRTGENAYNWRGGTPKVYYGPSWQAAKRAARQRDTVCIDCGKTPKSNGRALCVHHITPFRLFGVERHQEANSLENLCCHCSSCHLKREWRENSHTWPRRSTKRKGPPNP